MNGAELFIRCLENEGTEYVFGIPGEENIHFIDALSESDIRCIVTRHEQGAAFMADVYGRLTGKPGVCFATLGPGATNLITGFADANMDNAPIIAIAGQGATTRMHKESHQILDLVNLFEPISKYSIGLRAVEVIPEVVRKAFQVAAAEKPGGCFIDLPENIARAEVTDLRPLHVSQFATPKAPLDDVQKAAALIDQAKFPIILAGNGIVRGKACTALKHFAEKLMLPVANTFMAKGCLPNSHELSVGTIGLQAQDFVTCGFSRADVVICVGYDIVEYHPHLWHPNQDKTIIHIDPIIAEVDDNYIPACSVIGDISSSLDGIIAACDPQKTVLAKQRNHLYTGALREMIMEQFEDAAESDGHPLKPQKIVWDLRKALNVDDIVLSDVGMHKLWMARMYQAERPNTCIISNGFASMGISVPGAVAAKLVHPERTVVAVTGDAGFLMNSQELETALRIGTPMIVLIWRDNEYGLIALHQMKAFNRTSHISFSNPDFVKYAESFGAKGYRVNAANELLPILQQAIKDDTVAVIDCPVDYSENLKLAKELEALVCPV